MQLSKKLEFVIRWFSPRMLRLEGKFWCPQSCHEQAFMLSSMISGRELLSAPRPEELSIQSEQSDFCSGPVNFCRIKCSVRVLNKRRLHTKYKIFLRLCWNRSRTSCRWIPCRLQSHNRNMSLGFVSCKKGDVKRKERLLVHYCWRHCGVKIVKWWQLIWALDVIEYRCIIPCSHLFTPHFVFPHSQHACYLSFFSLTPVTCFNGKMALQCVYYASLSFPSKVDTVWTLLVTSLGFCLSVC